MEKLTGMHNEYQRDEIDLKELFTALWKAKFYIAFFTSAVTIAMIFYTLSLPNIYRSEAVLMPVTDTSGKLGGLSGQFGGLASLAGINIPGKDGDKTVLALETLKSREFFARFLEKNDVLIPLMAVSSWDPQSNKLFINPDVYDKESASWIRDVSFPRQVKPSVQEAHEVFLKALQISQEKSSGIVKVSVEHLSPYVAQQWIDTLVYEVNEAIRLRDIQEAQASINYLQQQIEITNISDIKTVLYELIEEQTKTLMLANVRQEYVFKTIDRAVVPEAKYKPGRAIMVIAAFLIAMISGVAIVLINLILKKQ